MKIRENRKEKRINKMRINKKEERNPKIGRGK